MSIITVAMGLDLLKCSLCDVVTIQPQQHHPLRFALALLLLLYEIFEQDSQ